MCSALLCNYRDGWITLVNNIKLSWNLTCLEGFLVSLKCQVYSLFKIEKKKYDIHVAIGICLIKHNFSDRGNPPL